MSAIALPAPPIVPPPWRRALPALALVLAAVLVLYRDTASAMIGIWWRSATFTHAFMVLPIAGWLIWQRRDELARVRPRTAPWTLLAMACAALAWLLGDLASANAVTQLAFVALLVLSVPAVLGPEVARRIAFPLGFLFFAVPIGEFMVPVLMSWTADFTVGALRLSGIPVYREGQQFVIPSGYWSVVEACSGVRYLMASLMVGVLYAYLNYRSARRRLLFSLVALVVPVIANWLRAYLIVLLGHLSDNRLAAGVDHVIYGWVFFGVVVLLMFMIGARWAEPAPPAAPRSATDRIAAPESARSPWPVAAAAVALVVGPVLALSGLERGVRPGVPPLRPPALAAGWTPVERLPADWTPAFHDASAELQRGFRRGDAEVGLYVAYYRHQDYRRKMVSPDNALVRSDDPHWSQVATATRAVQVGGRTLEWRAASLRGAGAPGEAGAERLVVWQIYWVDGVWTASEWRARVRGAYQRLLGRGDDAAVVVVSARQDSAGVPGGGDALVAAFVRDHLPQLDAQLNDARLNPQPR